MRKISTAAIGILCAASAAYPQDTIPFASTLKIEPGDSPEMIVAKAAHVVPSPRQAAALDREFIAFVHFGPNTFSRREWGTGMEDPAVFSPTGLDTDQWVKAMKDAGMKMVILTVKHHDGFVLWQSRYTKHGIMSSPFMDGKGDVLRDLSNSVRKYGLKLGVYLSPADLYQIENPQGLYGNLSPKTRRVIPRPVEGRPFENKTQFEFVVDDYNEYFLNQLFEILTEYGPIDEVWFDGAHPKRKGGQTYNYPAWKKLIRTLVPDAVIFGREDVRWCGNEAGNTRDTEWNVIPYAANPDTMGSFGDLTAIDLGSREKLMGANYLHYQLPETDTSIREGWFFRDDNTQRVRNADEVFDIYERSTGGNSVLLLNIPPAPDGRLGAEDVGVLAEVGRRISDTYSKNLLEGAVVSQIDLPGDKFATTLIALPSPATINRIVLREPIETSGERVESFTVEAYTDGKWQPIAGATNIGHKRIVRFSDVTTDSLRVRVAESRLIPTLKSVTAHYYKAGAPQLGMSRSSEGYVKVFPKQSDFNWHGAPKDAPKAMIPEYTVHYTLDGSMPGVSSPVFGDSLKIEGKILKAKAILADGSEGALLERRIGYATGAWSSADKGGADAFDGKNSTGWIASDDNTSLTIDMGAPRKVGAVSYTPAPSSKGGVAEAVIEVSTDGKKYTKAGEWEFGNLINDPTERLYVLDKAVTARYLRIVPKRTADGKPAVIAETGIYPER